MVPSQPMQKFEMITYSKLNEKYMKNNKTIQKLKEIIERQQNIAAFFYRISQNVNNIECLNFYFTMMNYFVSIEYECNQFHFFSTGC